MNLIEGIFGSKTRAQIFRLLFEQSGKELYLRELERQAGVSVRPIQQEIEKLLTAGLIKIRKDGNRVYYSANTEHPIFPEIHRIVEKTTGVQAILREALANQAVKTAFIFGSVASGKARPDSDLDLYVIGDIGLRKLSTALSGLSEKIGRVINPHVQSEEEFGRRVRAKDHFVTSLMNSDKTFILGNEDELKRLGKK